MKIPQPKQMIFGKTVKNIFDKFLASQLEVTGEDHEIELDGGWWRKDLDTLMREFEIGVVG